MTKTNQKFKKKIAEYVEDIECDRCGGQGWYAEHKRGCDGYCGSGCPVQEKCRDCSMTGISRPIRLEDILIALDKLKGITFFVNSDGRIFKGASIGTAEWKVEWKLNQPLENQSQETQEFLAEILLDNQKVNKQQITKGR